MRVVYVSTLAGGGPVSHLRDLAPAVAEEGADVEVVVATGALAAAFEAAGIRAHVAPLASKYDAAGGARMLRLLRGADVVHTQDRRAGWLARPAARLTGAAVVHTLHGLPEEIAASVGRDGLVVAPGVSARRVRWLLSGYLPLEGALARLGAVVTVSHAMRDFLVRHGVPRGRVEVIPSGIDVRRHERPRAHEPPRVGVVTKLEHWKGVDVLVDAAARIDLPFELHVFGDGSLRDELGRRARDAGVAATFHGEVTDARDRVAGMDVFVLPSRAENLPIAILEAMAEALPVVASRTGGIAELVADGETGLLAPPDDSAALAAAIESLLRDPERGRALGAAGAARAESEFRRDAVAARTLELYGRLAGRK